VSDGLPGALVRAFAFGKKIRREGEGRGGEKALRLLLAIEQRFDFASQLGRARADFFEEPAPLALPKPQRGVQQCFNFSPFFASHHYTQTRDSGRETDR
jgi:hypothetical protein